MKFKLTTCNMTEEMILRLKEESKRSGAPQAEIVRRAVDEYLSVRERSTTEQRNVSRRTNNRKDMLSVRK